MTELTNRVFIKLFTHLRREEGQTFVEYGLILALVAVGAAAALPAVRSHVVTALNNIVTSFGL